MCQALGPAPYFALDLSIGSASAAAGDDHAGRTARQRGRRPCVRDGDGAGTSLATPPVAPQALRRRAISGPSLADCVFSGRYAGAAAASVDQEETR